MPKKGSRKYKDSDFYGIIEDISTTTDGNEAICKRYGMDLSTFYRYMDNSEELHKRYARAKTKQADVIFHEMIERVCNVDLDKISIYKERLVIDTMKWVLGKLRPEKYGDRVTVDIDGDVMVKQLCATLNLPEAKFLRLRDRLDRGEIDFSETKLIEEKSDEKED